MITNPIYKKEKLVEEGNIKLSVIIFLFNSILAFFTLIQINIENVNINFSLEVDYGAFFEIFKFISLCEYFMIAVLVAGYSSSCISSEMEDDKFELMLLTKLDSYDVIKGKLLHILSDVCVVIISSMPVLALSFMYSGISIKDVVLIFMGYLSAMIFISSIGIFVASIFKKARISYIITYISIFVIFILRGGVLFDFNISSYMNWYSSEINIADILTFINPVNIFLISVNRIFGHYGIVINMMSKIFLINENIMSVILFILGDIVYLAIAIVLIRYSVKIIKRGYKYDFIINKRV